MKVDLSDFELIALMNRYQLLVEENTKLKSINEKFFQNKFLLEDQISSLKKEIEPLKTNCINAFNRAKEDVRALFYTLATGAENKTVSVKMLTNFFGFSPLEAENMVSSMHFANKFLTNQSITTNNNSDLPKPEYGDKYYPLKISLTDGWVIENFVLGEDNSTVCSLQLCQNNAKAILIGLDYSKGTLLNHCPVHIQSTTIDFIIKQINQERFKVMAKNKGSLFSSNQVKVEVVKTLDTNPLLIAESKNSTQIKLPTIEAVSTSTEK